MKLKARLYGKTYEFSDIREVMAKANEEKSGDMLAGICAQNAKERIAAKYVLSELTASDLRENPAVAYEEDSVTRVIQDDVDASIYGRIRNQTISEIREWILDSNTTGDMILEMSRGMTSEIIAGVCKIMSNLDLMYATKKINVTTRCNTLFGGAGRLGSRLQPNHPTDDPKGVLASVMEGLSYGVGDTMIGLNPSIDTVDSVTRILNLFQDTKIKYDIPTQICVLSHITTQIEAINKGAPADLCFQSLAGSQKGCDSFGITVDMLLEAEQLMHSMGTAKGPNMMYFETGQGSELSSSSHNGWDQLTMESRCYGLARHYHPFVVNTVVGFIGPEYLYSGKQVLRAGLEDNFCGHMHGLPMGCDICYTNHNDVDQNDLENLSVLLASSGCMYIMGIPHGDDVMLMYQTNSFHDIASLREMLGLKPSEEFLNWLIKWGIYENGKISAIGGDPTIFI